ncbi:GPI18 [Ecytonucleospora hepatopenaei]|uniref:GPI mannosyltransferase 2 n=1 Tax=Ecytonucleospora hepatopenaei TaxID=646526 RepID=A0A1W0E3T3_9MICR|nr:GPI18 [Ecytonucleospora hepatopenaei]
MNLYDAKSLRFVFLKLLYVFILSQTFLFIISFVTKYFFVRFDKSTANVKSLFSHLISWDAMHFIKIAQDGYFYEHAMAFMPLHISIINVIQKCLFFIFRHKIDICTLGIVLNNIYFFISALFLFKIVLQKTKNYLIAYKCAIYFILCIPGIIYSSVYTESLFTLLFLCGYYNFLQGNILHSILMFGISSFCRSNGILLILLFFDHDVIKKTSLNWFSKSTFVTNSVCVLTFITAIFLPFSLYQSFCLLLYIKNNCNFKIIVPYNFIQKQYWNQGFLKFITVQQIPNILIGMPYLALFMRTLFYFTKQNYFKGSRKEGMLKCISKDKLLSLFAIKSILLMLTMHWNMGGRFMAFHPYIYMYLAYNKNKHVMFILLSLRLLYIIMFSAYYPPA